MSQFAAVLKLHVRTCHINHGRHDQSNLQLIGKDVAIENGSRSSVSSREISRSTANESQAITIPVESEVRPTASTAIFD